MFFQSIAVYIFVISIMVFFGMLASIRGNRYLVEQNTLKVQRTFWCFEIVAPLLIFGAVMGMRYDVGTDHLTYLERYLSKEYAGKGEYVFFLFSDLGWYLNLHYAFYFGLIAFVQVTLFFLSFRDERYIFPFLVFFLFTNGSFLSWMNVIRQSLALCIWLYSLRYILEKKLVVYLIFCGIAFFCHRSAILLIALYPLLVKGYDYFRSRKLQLLILGFAFILNVLFEDLILRLEGVMFFYTSLLGEGMYENYGLDNLMSSFSENEGTGAAFLFKMLLNLIIIIISPRLKRFFGSEKFNMVYTLFFIGLFFTYIFPVGAISLTRPFRYFFIFPTIMYAYLAYYLFIKSKKNAKYLLALAGLIIAFLGIFTLSQFKANDESHSLYQFYFHNNHTSGFPLK